MEFDVEEAAERIMNTDEEFFGAYPENYKKYPSQIFAPEKKKIDSNSYTVYKARFSSLYDLYAYLKSNPKTNRSVFRRLHSETGSYQFAGKPYAEAVEDLIATVDPGYEEFLELQKDLNYAKNQKVHQYKMVRTVAGGHLNIPAYSAGAPLCYETEERVHKPKFVQLHVSLSYYCGTTKKQVLHRAIIVTNIIKALENAGYSVGLNTFELSEDGDELLYIVVQIKKHGERINMSRLYKTLCHVEFLRRILFRILETLDVTNDWEDGYGCTCSENFARKALKLDEHDIFIDQPSEMGIQGQDLATDFENAIKHLHLEDKIDVEKAKREFAEAAHSLKKKKN